MAGFTGRQWSGIRNLFKRILNYAQQTANWDSRYSYGPWQIKEELNTFQEIDGKKVPDYYELNSDLQTMRTLVADYYNKQIKPKLFKYELLK